MFLGRLGSTQYSVELVSSSQLFEVLKRNVERLNSESRLALLTLPSVGSEALHNILLSCVPLLNYLGFKRGMLRGAKKSGREYEVSVSLSKKISRINRRGFILVG